MNILILSWRGPGHPYAGGAEQATFEHAKGWVKAGHEVTLFTSKYRGAKKVDQVDGVKIIMKGGQAFSVKFLAFFWYLLGKHSKFDIVVDEFHGIPFFTPLYCRVRKLAFIHEVTKEVWKLNPWPKPLNLIPALLGTIFEPLIFKIIYRKIPFMTVSDSTKEDLIHWGINRNLIGVVNNGVTTYNLKQEIIKNPVKTAMFLGAISKDKGVFDAIKIFANIERKDDNWQYWMVGKGNKNYINDLKKLSKEMGINTKVKYFGFVDERKKFKLLSSAHVLINPSVREGWGLVNIEAALCETPVVGYDVPGVKDSVKNGKTGILVKLHDTQDAADEVIKLMRDSNRYQSFQKACRHWGGKFSWDKSTKQSLELIESL